MHSGDRKITFQSHGLYFDFNKNWNCEWVARLETVPLGRYREGKHRGVRIFPQKCSAVISQSWHPGNAMKEIKPGVTQSPSLCYIWHPKNTAALRTGRMEDAYWDTRWYARNCKTESTVIVFGWRAHNCNFNSTRMNPKWKKKKRKTGRKERGGL